MESIHKGTMTVVARGIEVRGFVYIAVNISRNVSIVWGTVIRRRPRLMANNLMIGISQRFDGYVFNASMTDVFNRPR
jgi:hypothetical protein